MVSARTAMYKKSKYLGNPRFSENFSDKLRGIQFKSENLIGVNLQEEEIRSGKDIQEI